jgi:NTE family protein
MIVSDAGAPFVRSENPSPLSLSRFKRIAEIAYDQTRSLRVRSFVNFLKINKASGMYLQIGVDPVEKIKEYGGGLGDSELDMILSYDWLPPEDVQKSAAYPTNLKSMYGNDFELLARHGFETIRWNNLLFN